MQFWPLAKIGHIFPLCETPSIGGERAFTERENVQDANRPHVYFAGLACLCENWVRLILMNLILGVRLILRMNFWKMLSNKIGPELFPAIAQYDGTEGQYSLPAIDAPAHA